MNLHSTDWYKILMIMQNGDKVYAPEEVQKILKNNCSRSWIYRRFNSMLKARLIAKVNKGAYKISDRGLGWISDKPL